MIDAGQDGTTKNSTALLLLQRLPMTRQPLQSIRAPAQPAGVRYTVFAPTALTYNE